MFKNAIVLTGGIATGKSTVAKLLMKYGFNIIDADKITHEILNNEHKNIALLFGNKYVVNNIVQRKELAKLIFTNKEKKQKLEKFIHPLIKEQIIKESLILEKINKKYIIDIPLFFEKRNYDIKNVIVVYSSKEQQLQRLINRDKSTSKEALSKISNQIDIEDKKNQGTYIINNTKTLDYLKQEVIKVKNLLG